MYSVYSMYSMYTPYTPYKYPTFTLYIMKYKYIYIYYYIYIYRVCTLHLVKIWLIDDHQPPPHATRGGDGDDPYPYIHLHTPGPVDPSPLEGVGQGVLDQIQLNTWATIFQIGKSSVHGPWLP